MATSDWGIGVVGLGGIAMQHLEGYRRQGLRVVAGAEIDPARGRAAQAQFALPMVTADFKDLLANPEVRIVDITVPHLPGLREPIVAAAAAAGKALFIQKPLMPNLDAARRLLDLAGKAPVMVNQNSLFAPAMRALEPYLRDERYIGRPYYFQIDNRAWFDPSGSAWYGKSDRWVTSDMAIHHFALILHWFGDPESVYAIQHRDPSQAGIAGDTLSAVTVRFRNGVSGVVINNWCYRGDRTHAHPKEEILIQGTRGAITGDSERVCVASQAPMRSLIYPEVRGTWFPDAFGHAMAHFVDSLDSGRPFLSEGHENLKAVGIIEAAYKSVEERREVRLEEFGL